MKILGVDFGEKKIGLALSEGFLSEPLIVVKKNWEKIIPLICVEQEIEKIIVGLAVGRLEEKQRLFAKKLTSLTGLPVEFQDETLTSHDAVAKMKQQGKRIKDEDAVAAALILQAYLDSKENV